MPSAESTFDWNDLPMCIDKQSVVPIVGRALLTVAVGDRQLLPDRDPAERLADRLHVRPDCLGECPGPDAVATA